MRSCLDCWRSFYAISYSCKKSKASFLKMKKIFFFSFLFFAFLLPVFSVEFYSEKYDWYTRGDHTITTISSVPCYISYTLVGSTGSSISYPNNENSTTIITISGNIDTNHGSISGQYEITDSRAIGKYIVVHVQDHGGDTSLDFNMSLQYGSPVDPENPNPDNPDPDDPSGGGSGGSGGSSDLPWARENTLHSTNSLINAIGTGLSNWSSWQRSTLNNIDSNLSTLGTETSNIKNHLQSVIGSHLEGINSFMIPINDNILAGNTALNTVLDYMRQNYSTYVSKFDLIKATLDTSNSRLTNVKNTLDTTNSRLTNIKGTLDTTNSHLNYIKNYTLDIKNNTSDIKDTLTDIKNTLNPPNSTIPSIDSVTTSLPSYSGVIASIKGKLLPGFSFFTPSGDEWLTLTVTIPLSSFGMNDFTFVFGGTQWATVGNGALLSLMSFCRTLSQFAFYYLLLMAIIKSLRQW